MDAASGWQVMEVGKVVGGKHRKLVRVYGKQVLVCISSKTRPNQVD